MTAIFMRGDTPQTIYLKDYSHPGFFIDQVNLIFHLEEDRTRVQSTLRLRRSGAADPADRTLRLDGEQLSLKSVKLDGRELNSNEYILDEESLTLHDAPDRMVLETEVEIRPQDNTQLEGLFTSNGMFCTQCEAEGFRKITFFIDRPDVMSRYSTTIVADRTRYPVLLSNGNLVEQTSLPGDRHSVRWEDPFPKPCYLFALVAGDLRFIEDSFTTASGRRVSLRVYVEPENINKCDHAMKSLKKAMKWDEENYGREYDLDIYMIVAANDFNMGAMENKGLNIFNSKYVLARPETATDADYQAIEGVIAHEYFHNWTGNRITCRDWFQLSLKEGLTVFRDQQFSADMGSQGVKRIEDVRILRGHQFAEDASPMAHAVRPDSYIEINNFYTATVYEKGAEVIRMQHNLLGPSAFRKGMDLYFERHDGQAVTTDDFVRCMEDAGGRDLNQFRLWYGQAGTPELRITDSYDEDRKEYTLYVDQACPATPGQPEKHAFHIPLKLGLLDSNGKDIPLRRRGVIRGDPLAGVLELRGRTECFHFIGMPERPVPSLLRGFSAPVKLFYDFTDRDLMFLMAEDNDDFNRWDAAQTLAQRVILDLVQRRSEGRSLDLPEAFLDAFRKVLTDENADKAVLAEILNLPSESYLGDQLPEVDVDGIHEAREAVRTQLAIGLKAELATVYRANGETGRYEPNAGAIARRRLKNQCLGYLVQSGDEEGVHLCLSQFEAQHNMTDVIAALALLADRQARERKRALAAFYDRWQKDPLVLDKWFAVQAASRLPDTLERVESLLGHPAFSIRNPNRVRSLVGTFCTANLLRFHDKSGLGYVFLVDRVLELDPLNPQVAARLLRTLARWRRFDSERQTLMRGQLKRVLDSAGVSKDVFEIASKSLQDQG